MNKFKGQREQGVTKRGKKRQREVNELLAENTLFQFEWEFYKALFMEAKDDVFESFNNQWRELVSLHNQRKTNKRKQLNPLSFYNTNINQHLDKDATPVNLDSYNQHYLCWFI